MTDRYLTPEIGGKIAFYVVQNGMFEPMIDSNINVKNIEDFLVSGIYNKRLPAMTKDDADFIISVVEELVDDMLMKK